LVTPSITRDARIIPQRNGASAELGHDEFGQVAPDLALVIRRRHHGDLLETRALHDPQPFDDLVGFADEAGGPNRLGCDEAAFFGLKEGGMAVVNLAETRIFRQAETLYALYIVGPDVGETWRDQLVRLAELVLDFVGEMEKSCDDGASLIDDSLISQLFAGSKDTGAKSGDCEKILGQGAVGLARTELDLFHPPAGFFRGATCNDPAVAKFTCGLQSSRAVCGNIDGNALREIDEMAILMEELNFARPSAISVIDGVAVQQAAQDA